MARFRRAVARFPEKLKCQTFEWKTDLADIMSTNHHHQHNMCEDGKLKKSTSKWTPKVPVFWQSEYSIYSVYSNDAHLKKFLTSDHLSFLRQEQIGKIG